MSVDPGLWQWAWQAWHRPWQQRWEHLELREAGIQADIDKCDFNAQEVVYLGLILTPDGVKMDPSKVKDILKW